MSTDTLTLKAIFELISCGQCGVAFGMPEALLAQRRRDHQTFYCPNGHERYFPGKSDLELARQEIDKYKQLYKDEQRYAAGVVSERNATQRQLSAARGQMTKLKKRIAGGVCPCCHRTFVQLQRHMESKHPEYTQEST